MPNKIFNTRIRNKRDTAANWETVASTFQPLDGEMIIVYTADGATRFKVGRYDSVKGRLLYYNELPFTDESLGNKIYTQNEEPVDAADGALWVDLDEISSSSSIIPRPTSADNGKYLGCENGAAKWMPVEASGGDKWELIHHGTVGSDGVSSYLVDSDGRHIGLLIMATLAYLAPDFIKEGRLCWLRSPLYIVDNKGKYSYYFDDEEFNKVRKTIKGEVTRAKGLGELEAEVARQSMFTPEFQRLERMEYSEEAMDLLYSLMGEDVAPRRDFIFENIDFSQVRE